MNRILIALDYNPTAQKVAETGFAMAKSMNAEVILLHVISDPVFYSTAGYSPIMGFNGYIDVGPVDMNNVEGLKLASFQYLDKTRQYLGDESIRTLVKDGDYADTILETAKETRTDILVIGTHSRRWLEDVLMGSVLEKVLRNTPIPLFIVPTKEGN